MPLSPTLRSVAEGLSRGVVLRRRLPAQFGAMPIYVTPETGLRFWGPASQVDPFLFRMAAELVKPESVVWDIGANVGLFSFAAAAVAGREGKVLAVEPDPWLCTLLNRSVAANQTREMAAVSILSAAISDQVGVSNFLISARARASNHLALAKGSSQFRESRMQVPVVTLTLDWLLDHFPPPTVLKIDVETHESQVLSGGRRLLTQARPVIWCEVDHQNSPAVTQTLTSANYTLKSAADGKVISKAWWNTLAVPS